ncbi:MAG: HAMP domain-containing histidine kinase [Ruminococcus sp.]|nr:HAMP domain-containing histidine kinase [Ruminococcus sp.]
MKLKLTAAASFFAAVMIALTAYFIISGRNSSDRDARGEQAVTVSEISRLYQSGRNEEADALTEELRQELIETSDKSRSENMAYVYCGVSLAVIAAVFCYVYFAVLRPFDKMKRFAEEIARGNFELPLNYERSNYFGSFTWAFDSMRREITKARRCEREAIENNKTVIATLSHDIKTPIASIRVYAEALEANLDSGAEKRQKYISVLMRKCDEVANLTNDLFLHSLADLDKLKMNPEPLELTGFLSDVIDELSGEQGDIRFQKPEESITVNGDRSRLAQLCGNLVNNARKYAKTAIDISVVREGEDAVISFRDYGKGIPDEDMPFITDKFYRGHNCGSEQGSGLGLYIAGYICTQLGGELRLKNCEDGGLLAEVRLSAQKQG